MRAAVLPLVGLVAIAPSASLAMICVRNNAPEAPPVAVAAVGEYEVRQYDYMTQRPPPPKIRILGGCDANFVPEHVAMFEIAYPGRKTFVVSDWKARQILNRFCGAKGKRAAISESGTAQSAGKRLSIHRIAGTCS